MIYKSIKNESAIVGRGRIYIPLANWAALVLSP